FAGAAAIALEPGFELGDFNAIESGLVPDFDAQRAEVEGILAAPIGAAELAKGDDGGFIEGFGGEGDGVVDAGRVAEGDNAPFGAVRHERDRSIFAFCSPRIDLGAQPRESTNSGRIWGGREDA